MVGKGSIWLRTPMVGAGYFILSVGSLAFSRFGAPTESIWLSNALLAAALAASPVRSWAPTLACAAAGHAAAHLLMGEAADITLVCLVGDMSECALVGLMLRRGVMAFAARIQVLRFLLVCGLIGPSVSSAVSAVGGFLIGKPMEMRDIAVWYGADALGMLIFMPLLHGFGHGRPNKLMGKPLRLAAAIALVVGLSLFAGMFGRSPLLGLLLLPLLVAAAFELGVAGTKICLAVLAVMWTGMVIGGHPPMLWTALDRRDTMLATQAFLAATAATVFPLAVVLERKEHLDSMLDDTLRETREAWGAIVGAEARYRLVVDHVSETVMRVSPAGQVLFASSANVSLLHGEGFEGRDLFSLMQPEDAAREREAFEQAQARDLLNLVARRTWRIRHAAGTWAEVDARVTMIAGVNAGGREFVVVLRPAA